MSIRAVVSFCFASLLACYGCKQKDDVLPMVSISSPSYGTTYSVLDTVSVEFEALDETHLASVTVNVVNADFIPVTNSVSVDMTSNSNMGSAQIILSNKLLETGTYYAVVTASDGSNEAKDYAQIKINALPKKRRSIFFSTSSGNGSDRITVIDSLFQNSSNWITASQDIKKISVNSLSDRLNLIGNFSTGILSYDIKGRSVVWGQDVFPLAQYPRYHDIFCDGNTVFATTYDREVRSYGLSGVLTMNLQTGVYRPETVYADANYLLIELNLVGDNDHFVAVHSASTKALLWTLDVPMDVIAICPLQSDEVLLFGNDGQQARVLHYDIGNNGYWEPRQLPAGLVLDAVKMDGQMFAMAHENGLYAYTYSPNYLNLIKAGTRYQDLCFDVDNGTILAASGSTLEEISLLGQTIHSFADADSITSIDVFYTR